jgi:hypothetical protein
MNRTSDRSKGLPPFPRLLALAALPVLLVLVFLSAAGAQEPTDSSTPAATIALGEATPAATIEPTPDLSVKTLVRLEIDPQTKPIPSGKEFEVRVMIDNVEHLASFSFTISYDPKRLQPVKPGSADSTPADTPVAGVNPVRNRALGDIFASSSRSEGVSCSGPVAQNSTVAATCVTRFPPICLGGPAGASGSGLLGAIYFKSKGGGPTTLTLSASDLVLDDYQQCTVEVQGTTGALPDDCLPIRAEPDDSADQLSCEPDGSAARVIEISGNVQERAWVRLEDLGWAATDFLQATGEASTIPNRRENASIELAKGGSSSTLLVVIIGVVVLVLIGGTGGYLWYRRRQARPSV